MKQSRGVVVICRLALFGALSVGCVAESETTTAQQQALLDGCSKDSQCEDGNPCTQNLCAVGLCLPALPVLGCCYEGNCTEPSADGAVAPIIELPPSGCSMHEDCEDGHPCTQNLCVAGECAALPVLGCCLDGDCSINVGGSSAGGSSAGGSSAGGSSAGGSSAEGGTSTGGTSSEGGAAAAGGSEPSMAGSTAMGGSATDGGTSSSEAGTAGTVSVDAEADYRLQGGGCTMGAKPASSSYASLVAGLLGAAWWLRGRRRGASSTASMRHS